MKFCEFFSKENFFRSKIFKKSFFFKMVELFIYLIFFHETEVWCQVLLKVLFFEKKITKFQTWKKKIFFIFSKGFTAEKILICFSFLKKKFFEMTFWFCRKGSMVPMMTLRLSKLFSWVRRTFSEKKKLADCISGHFKKQSFLGVFHDFLVLETTIVDYLNNKCWKKVFEFKSVGN